MPSDDNKTRSTPARSTACSSRQRLRAAPWPGRPGPACQRRCRPGQRSQREPRGNTARIQDSGRYPRPAPGSAPAPGGTRSSGAASGDPAAQATKVTAATAPDGQLAARHAKQTYSVRSLSRTPRAADLVQPPAEQGGISTYEHHAAVPPTPIKDPPGRASCRRRPGRIATKLRRLGSRRLAQAAAPPGRARTPPRSRSATPTRPATTTSRPGARPDGSQRHEPGWAAAPARRGSSSGIPSLADTYHATPASLAPVTDATTGSSASPPGACRPIAAAAVGCILPAGRPAGLRGAAGPPVETWAERHPSRPASARRRITAGRSTPEPAECRHRLV